MPSNYNPIASLAPILAFSILSACATPDAANESHSFGNTDWVLYEYSTASTPGTLIEAPLNSYRMRFETDGTVTYTLDCNRGFGTWSANGSASAGSVDFGPIRSTRASCGPDDIAPQITADLEQASTYTVYDGLMTLEIGAGPTTYVWDRID